MLFPFLFAMRSGTIYTLLRHRLICRCLAVTGQIDQVWSLVPAGDGKEEYKLAFRRFLSETFQTFTWFVVIVLILGALLMLGTRPFGYTPYVIMSGSMEPAYPAGSLVYVQKTDPLDVETGDPITFVLNEDLVVATHRVVSIDRNNQRFTTKGDANDNSDSSPVLFKNLIGVPRFQIPKLGFVVHAVSTPPGKYYSLGGVALLIIAMIAFEIVNPKEKRKEKTRTKSKPDKRQEEFSLD